MNGRDFALLRLDEKYLPHWPKHAVALRYRKNAESPADVRDRALAEQIEIGTVKNLLLLQYITKECTGRELQKIDPLVQKVIGIALYQIRFLTRVPAAAAVHEAVEQARRFGQGKAAGFVNAALREAIRRKNAPLPSPDADPRAYAEAVLSHPGDLFDRLVAATSAEQVLAICRHNNIEPPCIQRLARDLKPDVLAHPSVTVLPHETPGMYVVTGATRSILARWAAKDLAQVQDPTSASVVSQCGIALGQTLLDRCCGVGTKTLQMREIVGETARIVAIDNSPVRCATLRATLADRRISNVQVYEAAHLPAGSKDMPALFDLALVDAPCSNSGVLARRPEARYTQGKDALISLSHLQKDILSNTAPRIRAGGLMVYSTCSIWPEENRGMVDAFLTAYPEYRLERDLLTLPSCTDSPTTYHDGGYYAVMRRQS